MNGNKNDNDGQSTSEFQELRELVAEIIDEKTAEKIFTPKENCVFHRHRFLAKCETCDWPGKNEFFLIDGIRESEVCHKAIVEHDKDLEKKLTICLRIPSIYLFS